MLTKDDIYEGYFIAEGSLVLANIWSALPPSPGLTKLIAEHRAILHDPTAYPDPESFVPGRFLRTRAGAAHERDVELDPDVRDPALVAFGFGRRVCPGRHMAYESLWIAIASLVATFDITKAVDEHDQVIEPSEEYTDGFLS